MEKTASQHNRTTPAGEENQDCGPITLRRMKPRVTAPWNPRRLDVMAFAKAGALLADETVLSCFERLADFLHSPDNAPDTRPTAVRWRVEGVWEEGRLGQPGRPWLHLHLEAEIPLTCQRCLGPVGTPLSLELRYRFVADEATAEIEDEQCEEDVLALEPRPNLLDLIEDELMMALPMLPMHERCPDAAMHSSSPIKPASDDDIPPPRRPFAALVQLKPTDTDGTDR